MYHKQHSQKCFTVGWSVWIVRALLHKVEVEGYIKPRQWGRRVSERSSTNRKSTESVNGILYNALLDDDNNNNNSSRVVSVSQHDHHSNPLPVSAARMQAVINNTKPCGLGIRVPKAVEELHCFGCANLTSRHYALMRSRAHNRLLFLESAFIFSWGLFWAACEEIFPNFWIDWKL